MVSCALMEERNDIVMPQREKREEKRGSIDTYVTKTLRQKAAGLVGLLPFKCCVREKNQRETKAGGCLNYSPESVYC